MTSTSSHGNDQHLTRNRTWRFEYSGCLVTPRLDTEISASCSCKYFLVTEIFFFLSYWNAILLFFKSFMRLRSRSLPCRFILRRIFKKNPFLSKIFLENNARGSKILLTISRPKASNIYFSQFQFIASVSI